MYNEENQPPQQDTSGQLPEGFVPGPTHRELMAGKLARQKQETEDAVNRIIANSPNKEPFNYQKFAGLYWKKDTDRDLTGEEDNVVIDAYKTEYYLQFDNVQTVEDYAKTREALDAEAGN